MGANFIDWYQQDPPEVSIHAPVMGANYFSVGKNRAIWVSIHAPVMGAKRLDRRTDQYNRRFNPRTRDGCEVIFGFGNEFVDVSIHAPVMGANKTLLRSSQCCVFQSTHP